MFRKDDIKIIIIAIIGLFFLLVLTTEAADCNKHPIYCQIKKNRPKISKKYAMVLSNVIYKATRKYHIPPRIFTAILAQESSYSLKAKGCHRGLLEQDREMIEVKICADFGIGQIYFKTAKGFGFDISMLTTDLEYSIDAAAQVLGDFKKRYERREVTWWTRYNARSKIKRKIYKQLVERYF